MMAFSSGGGASHKGFIYLAALSGALLAACASEGDLGEVSRTVDANDAAEAAGESDPTDSAEESSDETTAVAAQAVLGDTCPSGKKCIRCYELTCDRDGDTYADGSCSSFKYWEYTSKKACPSGYLQETEGTECDRYTSATRNHARPWISSANYSSTANIHPHRDEAQNGVDDDCDGLIDEAEVDYSAAISGAGQGDGQVDYKFLINDPQIVRHANLMSLYVYKLGDLTEDDLFGRFPTNQRRSVTASPCIITSRPYSGQLIVQGKVSVCADVTRGVHVVVPTFSYKTSSSLFREIACWDDNGAPLSEGECDGRKGIYADAQLQAEYRDANTQDRVRSLVVNRALYEWYLSEKLGWAGFQDIGDRPWPGGTRYGASYGELWCSEFAAHVYNWSTPSISSGLDSVDDIKSYFSSKGAFLAEYPARSAIRSSQAQWGDYLAINWTGEAGKKSHSALFLAFGVGSRLVWRVAGNEGNQVVVAATSVNYVYNGQPFHAGLGQLTNESPRY